jgi:hypothetical protein
MIIHALGRAIIIPDLDNALALHQVLFMCLTFNHASQAWIIFSVNYGCTNKLRTHFLKISVILAAGVMTHWAINYGFVRIIADAHYFAKFGVAFRTNVIVEAQYSISFFLLFGKGMGLDFPPWLGPAGFDMGALIGFGGFMPPDFSIFIPNSPSG